MNATPQYIAERAKTHPEIAAFVETLDALPLYADWGGSVALRSDGELIGFLWDELERDGRTLATAKETKLFFLSNSRISYTVKRHSRELTLKNNIWSLRGRQYLLWDGQGRVGVIEHDNDFGADIDLPPEIPLAVQIFIYRLAFIMWQRWR